MSLLNKFFDSTPQKNLQRPFTDLARQRAHSFVDKKRTTFYLSRSVSSKVQKLITRKKISKSASVAIENFFVELIKENS